MNNKNSKKDLILIGVCTYNRPRMLEECLISLKEQEVLEDTEVVICVADNNSDNQHNIKELVNNILNGHKFNYVFVNTRGISFARNAVVDYAIELNADYIAFIDDDECAAKDWIKKLYNKIKSSSADVVQGRVSYKLPENTPDIVRDIWKTSCAEDAILKHVGTNNVIFHKRLIQEWQLRFNGKLALTGGEDLDFFLKSGDKGGKHIFTNEAVVFETVPEVRSTVKWQLIRKMRDGFAVSYVMYLNRGWGYVLRKYVIKAIKNLITAPFDIFAGVLFSKEKLKFKGMQKLFYAAGCIAFACNIKINGYKKITGN